MINISALEDSIKLSEAMVMNLRPGVEKKYYGLESPLLEAKLVSFSYMDFQQRALS